MDGYAKLATLMGAYPEVAIIRRFAALNMQNVLYLQAELVNLESRLRRYETEDRESGEQERIDFGVDWFKLRHATDIVNPASSSTCSSMNHTKEKVEQEDLKEYESRRYRVIINIREKLKEYNEAVMQQTALAQLTKPNPRDLSFLTEWMTRPDMGNVLLAGEDSDVWETPDRLDLVVLKSRKNESLLSAWLSDKFIHWYHQAIGYRLQRLISLSLSSTSKPKGTNPTSAGVDPAPDPENVQLDSIAKLTSISYHSQATLVRIARVFAMMLASLLPIAAIVVLYAVHSMPKRLGIIGGFTAAFSLVLGLVTHGELVDVFAASAAFAAVQVVFVGSTDTGKSQAS